MAEVAMAYPQYTFADLDELPSIHFQVLYSRLSLGEFRRHYMSGQLISELRNFMGGKKNSGESVDPSTLYEATECMPRWALPNSLYRDLPFTPRQCWAIMQAIADRELPNWAVQTIHSIMPLQQIKRHGGATVQHEESDGFEEYSSG